MERQPGLMHQLRSLHWAVKFVLAFVAWWFFPFALAALAEILGDAFSWQLGILLFLGSVIASFWFVFTSPRTTLAPAAEADSLELEPARALPVGQMTFATTAANRDVVRYCETCGHVFAAGAAFCPSCGSRWAAPVLANPVRDMAQHLNRIVRDFQDGLIDATSYVRLRTDYERRLDYIRNPQPAPQPAAPTPPVPAVTPVEPAVPASPPVAAAAAGNRRPALVFPAAPDSVEEPVVDAPPPAAAPPGPTFGDMTRTALGWAAERQADILLYVGAFMLSVAAVIFLAYQGEAVSGGVRIAVLTAYAIGFLTLGILLFRWERVREAGPVFLALGAILVPMDFVALRFQVGDGSVPEGVLWLLASSCCTALYLILGIRGYGRLYYASAAPSALVAWGSIAGSLGFPLAWFGPWYVAPASVLYVAGVRGKDEWYGKWLVVAGLVIGGAALAHTQAICGFTGDSRWALPAAYAVATVALGAGLRWRRDAAVFAALPAGVALASGSFAWAGWDLSPEWFAVFVGVAGLGYLVVSHFDAEERARDWGLCALFAFAASIGVAHMGAPFGDAAVLPAAYGVAFAGASGAYARWRWAEAAAAMPALALALAASTLWASGEEGLEWYGVAAGIATLGYHALALFDRADRREAWQFAVMACGPIGPAIAHVAIAAEPDTAEHWALVASYGAPLLASIVATAVWRFACRPGPGALVVLVPLVALVTSWVQWDLAEEWYPAFGAAAAVGFVALAWLDRPFDRGWAALAFAAGAVSLTGAHVFALEVEPVREPLPITYGIVLTAAAAATTKWRFSWSVPVGLMPPLVVITGFASAWAAWDVQPEWFGCSAVAVCAGYMLLAYLDAAGRRRWWEATTVVAVVALGLVHPTVALSSSAEDRALPAVYGGLLLLAGASFALWRFQWRVAPAAIPALAAGLALSLTWAERDVSVWWWGAFIAPAAAGYVVFTLFDRETPPRAWLAGAWAAVALGCGLAFFSQAHPDADSQALPIALGESFVVAAAIVARWRLGLREWVGTVPPLAALFGAAAAWAWLDMPLEGLPAWSAACASGFLFVAWSDREERKGWRVLAVALAGASLAVSHLLTTADEPVRSQLGVTYAVAAASFTAYAVVVRDELVLVPPALVAMAGSCVLWSVGVEAEWWAYPWLAVATGLFAAARILQRHRLYELGLTAYALALATIPTLALLVATAAHHEHGLATQAIAAALVLYAAIRSNGSVAKLAWPNPSEFAIRGERIALIQGAFAFVFGATASFNGLLELSGAERAWALAAVAFVGWVILGLRPRWSDSLWTFAPVGLTGFVVAMAVASESAAMLTGVLAAATVGPLVAYAGVRRWSFIGIANTFLFLAVWAAWQWRDVDLAYLPLALAGLAALEWAALTRLRRYAADPDEGNVVVAYLSWAPWLLSGGIAGVLLADRNHTLVRNESLVTTSEWALAAAVLGLAAAAVTGEGLRLWQRWVWTPGSAGLLVALLMGIATFEPSNEQVFTAPVGAYLVVIGLTFRKSPEFVTRHLYAHEFVMLAGAVLLVAVPAAQSFDERAGLYGIELFGLALGLLLVGLLLHARWLVATGVTTLTATAMRMVTGGLVDTPYWLLFGIGGTAVIGFGLLLLLERERWDRLRVRVVEWWQETAASAPAIAAPPPSSADSA